jgi:hypothetical protein
MTAASPDVPFQSRTQTVLARLEALMLSGVLSQAEYVSCSGLAEALRRPARVAVLGQSPADVTGVLAAMLEAHLVTMVPEGPAVEIFHGPDACHMATFEDGSSLSQDGYPRHDLMRYGPLLLQIEAPLPILATMAFLGIELGPEPEAYTAALGWAAKRSEIAIFCTEGFGDAEATIWRAAPDRLKNHCYLVITGDRDAGSARAHGAFDAVIHAPAASEAAAPLAALKHRLAADITAAREEDIDAAELFLRRFRREDSEPSAMPGPRDSGPAPDPGLPPGAEAAPRTQAPPPAAAEPPEAAQPPAVPDTDPDPEEDALAAAMAEAESAARRLVSGPLILHLKRRSRALAEILEWREEGDAWPEQVLEHCAETAEALRELVAAWPDDDPVADRLRAVIDQACDTVVLLQLEAGPQQAEDAARVLYQLRTDFEQEMAA